MTANVAQGTLGSFLVNHLYRLLVFPLCVEVPEFGALFIRVWLNYIALITSFKSECGLCHEPKSVTE